MRDQFDLSGRVVVITGGSRGIGRAMAIGMTDTGATAVPAARTEEVIERVASEIEDRGGEAMSATTYVTDEDNFAALFDRIEDTYGDVDVVIDNAGINPDAALGTPERVDPNAFDYVTDVNLRGAFCCARNAAEYLHDHAVFLASDAASYVTGATIAVDGGWTTR